MLYLNELNLDKAEWETYKLVDSGIDAEYITRYVC